jgi:hypothetical protein
MSGKSRVALALLALSGCGGDDRGGLGHTSAAQTVAPTVFALAARQGYVLPPQIPDDLLEVPDLFGPPESTVSLRTGEVIGAWTTAPLPSGDPASLVYRCRPDADGDFVWSVAPDTGLVPLGIDPADLAAALPFAAEHTLVEPAGLYLYAPTGPAWTVTGPGLRTQLIAPVDAEEPLAPYGDVPLCRYRKAIGVTSGVAGAPALDRADYVLRLDTQGGVGPDLVGAPCDPGSLDVRSEVSADFYFVSLPGSVGPRVP